MRSLTINAPLALLSVWLLPLVSGAKIPLPRQGMNVSTPGTFPDTGSTTFNEGDGFTGRIYAALGDSFAAGIGAGNFFTGTPDGQDNPCARMTGSYPAQLFNRLELTRQWETINFLACSGHVLNDIEAQASNITTPVDMMTLSISGNDFGFGNVVGQCVYQHSLQRGKGDQNCRRALNFATKQVYRDDIYADFVAKINIVKQKIKPDGWLYITGYSKFFSSVGSERDDCSRNYFFKKPESMIFGAVKISLISRRIMNSLVDEVNKRIQETVIAQAGGDDARIKFIDIEAGRQFDNKRFCEPGKPMYGDNVWFNDLYTNLAERGDWFGPAYSRGSTFISTEDPISVWPFPDGDEAAWKNLTTTYSNDPDLVAGRGLLDKLLQNSVFHPSESAHEATYIKLEFQVIVDMLAPLGYGTVGPGQTCKQFGLGSGETCWSVPEGCAVANPLDNTAPQLTCENGTSPALQSI